MLYDLDLINGIRDILVERRQTVSVAESVTSGHLQAAFSAATEASKFFQGGITAYNAGQKCRHLNIEFIHAQNDDCVSEIVATQMAREVNKLFLSEYGIAITGYATRIPETGVNDLFAIFAISSRDKILFTRKISSTKEDGIDAQVDYTMQVLQAFKELLAGDPSKPCDTAKS